MKARITGLVAMTAAVTLTAVAAAGPAATNQRVQIDMRSKDFAGETFVLTPLRAGAIGRDSGARGAASASPTERSSAADKRGTSGSVPPGRSSASRGSSCCVPGTRGTTLACTTSPPAPGRSSAGPASTPGSPERGGVPTLGAPPGCAPATRASSPRRSAAHVARGEELRDATPMTARCLDDDSSGQRGWRSSGSVLMGALLVSIDDGSASDGAVSLASAAPSKIAFIRSEYRPGWSPRSSSTSSMRTGADRGGCWKPRDFRLPPRRRTSSASDPAWSPDGRKIAFVGMGDDGNTDVYVVGADGLGQQRLTRHPGVDGNPAWSPDGRKIAFTRGAREWCAGKTHIYVMNADGSRQRRLARGHVHFSVAWSPDGRKMLFERPNPRHPAGPYRETLPRISTS